SAGGRRSRNFATRFYGFSRLPSLAASFERARGVFPEVVSFSRELRASAAAAFARSSRLNEMAKPLSLSVGRYIMGKPPVLEGFMDTPVSLLERLRLQPAEADWHRLDQLYRPLIQHWLLRDP